MKSCKKVQSILHLAVLFSALIFTTGCFKKKEGINIPLSAKNVRGTRSANPVNNHNNQQQNHQQDHHNNNGHSDHGWLAVQPAYQAEVMEDFLVDFLDSDDLGYFEGIEISFYNGDLDIRIWDDLGDITLNLRKETIFCNAAPCPQAYTDGQGYVTFLEVEAIDNERAFFRIDFDNTYNGNGTTGTLGYVELYLCEVEGTC